MIPVCSLFASRPTAWKLPSPRAVWRKRVRLSRPRLRAVHRPGLVIASPHVGVFRSAAAKGLEVGSLVDASSILGSIQTLDEMNDVKAGVAGKIVEVRVRDGDFVEFGQPLYRILPKDESQCVN